MTTQLAVAPTTDCWNTIGIRGDRTCPDLVEFDHCHNCPVFAAAGRRFLDALSPEGYLEEWTARLALPEEEAAHDLESALVFRLADECLAFSVHSLVELTTPRAIHRVPFRSGLLAGMVNIRGELYPCAHLIKLLGIETRANGSESSPSNRLLVAGHGADRWVFPVESVEQVIRVDRRDIGTPPVTVGRAATHFSRGVFTWEGNPVGLLDHVRIFETLRARIR